MIDSVPFELVVPGLRPGFFPMRPTLGTTLLTEASISRLITQAKSGEWVLQPKLNGDRATLSQVDGEVYIFNRHGSIFKHTVINHTDYKTLPNGTVLDGEVYEKHFTPFEALAVGGVSFMTADVTVRIAEAKKIAERYDEWMFEAPTKEQLIEMLGVQGKLRVPKWEGVVKKKTGTPYVPLATDSQESSTWFKHKWCK